VGLYPVTIRERQDFIPAEQTRAEHKVIGYPDLFLRDISRTLQRATSSEWSEPLWARGSPPLKKKQQAWATNFSVHGVLYFFDLRFHKIPHEGNKFSGMIGVPPEERNRVQVKHANMHPVCILQEHIGIAGIKDYLFWQLQGGTTARVRS